MTDPIATDPTVTPVAAGDPITATPGLGDRLAILPKLWSTYAALIGGALIAAPVDWAHFDFKALSINQVVLAVIWLVGYFTTRVSHQSPPPAP